MPKLKIDQQFLDKVAEKHNKDYPKEYWGNGGHMPNTDTNNTMEEEIKKQLRFQLQHRIPSWTDNEWDGLAINITNCIRSSIAQAVAQAKREVAEEIIDEITILYGEYLFTMPSSRLGALKTKYLPKEPKESIEGRLEKLSCGCPRPDRFSMCIDQSHIG